jgi:phospholipid/cholesterol/gamma-HCH transport system substrate-binding protein
MIEKSRSLELKVGIFVFIGIVILAWFVLLIGNFKLLRVGYNIKVAFGFANGIKIGAPVRIAGVDKGEVKEIRLMHDEKGQPKIFITAYLDGDAQIPADSRAWVNTLGLLGEKYLEIIPGKDYKNILPENGLLVGEDPTSIQEVTDLAKDIALQAKDMLGTFQETLKGLNSVLGGQGTVGKLLTDDRLYNDIEEMFADLKKHPWKLLYRPKEVQ